MTTTDPTQPHICTADGGPACPGHTPPPLPPEPDPGPYLIGEFFALRRDGTTTAERWLSISVAEGGHRWSSWEDLAREAGCPDVPIRRLVPAPEPVTLSAADVAERAAVATGRPPRASAGASLVSGEYDEAAAHHDALLRQVEDLRQELVAARQETARVRSQLAEAREALARVAATLGWDAPPEQAPSGIPDLTIAVQQLRHERDQARAVLAEARQQRDQAADALVQAETERDAAREIIDDLRVVLALSPGQSLTQAVTQLRDDLAWLRRQVLAVAEDLERYASDLRTERLPMSERKLALTLRQIVAGERPEAPETAPESPQTGEQAQVRVESHTEASAGADGPWSDAWCRTQLQRLSIAASEQYRLRWRDYDVVGAVIEELATLHARNREWEQTLGDLAARCDSGDIPIRLGERYSLAVLREIDRLRDQWRTLATLVEPLGILDADSTDPATLTDRICRWISDLREDSAYQARVLGERQQEIDQLRAEWSALRGQVGRAIVLCGPRGDKPIDVIVASVIDDLEEARQENADLRAQLAEARADLAKLWDATGIPSDADMHLEDVADTIRRMAHDDRAIRRLLRDHGVSVGDVDPLPAIVAETVRRSGAELVELRYRHEQVCQELAEAREALVAAQTEGDEAWDRLSNLVDELAGALEMDGTPDDHEIIREARAFGQLRVELAALRAGVLDLADRVTTHAKGYGEPLEDVAEELRTLTAGSTPDSGSTDG